MCIRDRYSSEHDDDHDNGKTKEKEGVSSALWEYLQAVLNSKC